MYVTMSVNIDPNPPQLALTKNTAVSGGHINGAVDEYRRNINGFFRYSTSNMPIKTKDQR